MAQAEAISFKTTKLCNDVATPINTTVEQYFQIIATASALEAPMSIYLTGANADQFALSVETLRQVQAPRRFMWHSDQQK